MKNIIEFTKQFKTEQDCIDYLKKTRGTSCPFCKHEKTYEYANGKLFKCAKCRKQFTLRMGTIFQDSRLPLVKWFTAMFLLSNSKKGISSVDLAEKIGVTQKTAWFLYHRIRKTYKQPEYIFEGAAETDETYVGGKEKNKHAHKKIKGSQGGANKMVIVGMVERGTGKIKSCHVPNTKAKTLKRYIYNNLKTTSTLYTDDNLAYRNTKGVYNHEYVVHSKGEYVKRDNTDCHTNTIESFWAIFKRGYTGVYHYMSPKHLHRFINEFVFRWNHRNTKEIRYDRFMVSILNMDGKLSYKKLVHG